uniref:3-hydroxyacyl-CoA dehydrogenase NAD binding domain-containing protein n=1 Tax=Stomoxys calcitrans TaxID=35570 RepID=A0A1I8Q8G3_STOCA
MATSHELGKIGIIGSGLIGRSWSMLFASVGYQVMVYDILPNQVANDLKETQKELNNLESKGLIRGDLSASQQFSCISGVNDLSELVKDAILIQECIPENLDMKINLYQQLDKIVENNTIMSSSTSTFLPSYFSKDLKYQSNVVVAHPVNPPYYVPLVEIVPAPWTCPDVVTKTRAIMEHIGQKPITLSREIPGFALNRIQLLLVNECWRLVEDGILNVPDVESIISDGLGMRYAFLGAFETIHLNAEGMRNFLKRYAHVIDEINKSMGATPKMEGPTADLVIDQLEKMVPLDKLPERREYRDNCLTQLGILKKKINNEKLRRLS